MIKPPFTADQDVHGTWIENDEGVVVAHINHLIPEDQALELAGLLASGANFLHGQREHARKIAKIGGPLGGRPRVYEPRKPIEKPKQKRGRPRKPKKPPK